MASAVISLELSNNDKHCIIVINIIIITVQCVFQSINVVLTDDLWSEVMTGVVCLSAYHTFCWQKL